MSEKVFGSKKRGSIKDIPLPDADSMHTLNLGDTKQNKEDTDHDGGGDTYQRKTRHGNNSNNNKRMGLKIGIGALFMVLLLVGYSYMFHSGSVTIQERTTEAVLAGESINAALNSESSDTLSFTRVGPFTQTETIFVEGSEEENRQTKATGELTVYNTDPTEKNYIKNTRFQTSEGLVYRAFNRFTIPAGSEENPGSAQVLVVAESPGEKYNNEDGHTFKLPALKEQGDPAYDAVSAEQAEPLTGGYSGVVMVPSEQDIQEAQAKLSTRLENDLFDSFLASLEDGMITYPVFTESSDPTYTEEVNDQDGGVDVVARMQVYAAVFDASDLQEAIAQSVLGPDVEVSGVSITNLDQLDFTLTDNDFDPQTSENISFDVTGEGQFVWEVDEELVAQTAAGKLGSHIENDLVSELSDVSITDVSISPFWRRSLPSNPADIDVIIQTQES